MKVIFQDGYHQTILTLQEAVYMKGNESQIKKFNKDGRLPTNQLKAIEKLYLQEYESVESEGKGKNKTFILGEKRLKTIILDKRSNNKATGRKTPFANELELLIIKNLRESEDRSIEGSIGNIMHETKMAYEKLCYFKQPDRIENYSLELKKQEIDINTPFLNHVLNKEHTVLSSALLTALNNLSKKKLISWTKKKVGAVKSFEPECGELTGKPIIDEDDNPVGYISTNFITLTTDQEIKLAQIDRELMTKHNVKTFELIHYTESNKVRAYQRERKKLYREMGFEYHFDCYCIQLLASEKEVDELLEENEWMLQEVYLTKATQYAIKKAEKRQQTYLDSIFGQPEEISPIRQELAKGVYVDKYKTTLKHTFLGPEFEELLD